MDPKEIFRANEYDEEVSAIVIDNGSGMIKAGFAGKVNYIHPRIISILLTSSQEMMSQKLFFLLLLDIQEKWDLCQKKPSKEVVVLMLVMQH